MNIEQILKGIKGITKSITKSEKTPEELAKYRREICSNCDKKNEFTMVKMWRCLECGCLIDFKLSVYEEHCPLKKW